MDHSIAWYSKIATKIPIQYSVTMLFCFCYGGCKVVIKLSALCWLLCHPFFSLSFAKNILTNNNRLWTPNIFSNIPNVFAAWAGAVGGIAARDCVRGRGWDNLGSMLAGVRIRGCKYPGPSAFAVWFSQGNTTKFHTAFLVLRLA